MSSIDSDADYVDSASSHWLRAVALAAVEACCSPMATSVLRAFGAGFLIFLPGFPLVGGSWQCRRLLRVGAVDGTGSPCTSPPGSTGSLRFRLGPNAGGADCCRSAIVHSPQATLTTLSSESHQGSALTRCIPSQLEVFELSTIPLKLVS